MVLPTLMSYLKSVYDKSDDVLPPLEDRADADHFVAFCENYLATTNPAVEPFYAPVGLGLRLANNDKVLLSAGPEQETTGDMQDSSSVKITNG
jgi:hypothetical protein